MNSSNPDPPICCQNADILIKNDGKISFGHGCIIHPKAKIVIEGDCSIIFGEYNIIEENVVIKATPRFSTLLNNTENVTVYIGCYNHFKIGSYVENTSVENYVVFDYKSHVEDSYIESKCIITPRITLPKKSSIKAGSIVLANQIIVQNSNFNENEFIHMMKEMYRKLSILLPKSNKMHNISS